MNQTSQFKTLVQMPRILFAAGITCLVAIASTAAAADNLSLQRRFEHLERQFQQAETESDFAAVAAEYEGLKDQSGANVSVLFNQANAWFNAGKFGRAIVGYRKALRLDPRDAAIRNNLNLALQRAGQEVKAPTALDYALFWKDRMAVRELAIVISVLLFLSAILFLKKRTSDVGRTVLKLLCCVTLILMVSFAVKVSAEDLTLHGVVIESTDARKGPANSYEPAFSNPLADGREFIVIRQQQDWIEINIEGIGTGWVSAADVILY